MLIILILCKSLEKLGNIVQAIRMTFYTTI